jgi:bisphosphoglycerate-independent phosphoglycerate mutase (AlkP superfamily)
MIDRVLILYDIFISADDDIQDIEGRYFNYDIKYRCEHVIMYYKLFTYMRKKCTYRYVYTHWYNNVKKKLCD